MDDELDRQAVALDVMMHRVLLEDNDDVPLAAVLRESPTIAVLDRAIEMATEHNQFRLDYLADNAPSIGGGDSFDDIARRANAEEMDQRALGILRRARAVLVAFEEYGFTGADDSPADRA